MIQKQERLLQQDTNAHRKKIEQKLHIGAVDYHVMQNYSDLNQASQDSGKPYTDLEITDDYILREFSETIDPIELLWHRDDEARTVEIIGETDWMLQLDNSLPTSLQERIFIPKHEWHRVIKGTGTLKLKIYKNG
tara:strand:+ start:71 stop:475 length:405 start_codon:yes stop_codon:yes gene_type:complete